MGVGREILLDFLERLLGERVGGRKNTQEDDVGRGVALAVIVEKEKQLVLADRPADIAAKLVEVIRLLDDAPRVVDERVGVHGLVAIEPEPAAVQLVGSGLGDHVDHTRAGAAGLGVVAAVVDLELLHRVLAERVGIANTRAS